MMKYVIWGAGVAGKAALDFLGFVKVECFIDNQKVGSVYCGKDVISIEDYFSRKDKDELLVIIASRNYWGDMEGELKTRGIKRYFLFDEAIQREIYFDLPGYHICGHWNYMSYADVLANYHIEKYKRIAVYGVNKSFPYLLLELISQCSYDSILGVADPSGSYTECLGIPAISMEEAMAEADCIIINVRLTECNNVREKLENMNINFADIYDVDKFVSAFQHPELIKYKNIHNGKRAFIICNGPSLRIEDLNTLHENEEVCFASNMIYRVYDKTEWRADYLCFTDPYVISLVDRDITPVAKRQSFWADDYNDCFNSFSESKQYIHLSHSSYYPSMPRFSNDITKGVGWGYTVTYDFLLQIAAYMGFGELYIIGCDHKFTGKITEKSNHFMGCYTENDTDVLDNLKIPPIVFSTRAYEKAELYSKRHGFRIYNATRGGELEVFERVDFDSLF